MREKRKCLKFVGYVYLPSEDDNALNNIEALKKILYYKEKRNGRLKIYDDYNANTISERDMVFDSWADLLSMLEAEYRKRSDSRIRDRVRVIKTALRDSLPKNEVDVNSKRMDTLKQAMTDAGLTVDPSQTDDEIYDWVKFQLPMEAPWAGPPEIAPEFESKYDAWKIRFDMYFVGQKLTYMTNLIRECLEKR